MLTTLQRELLDLFATDLSDDELREVRGVLARHFAAKATAAFDQFTGDTGLAPEETDRWAYAHDRARGARTAADGAAGDGA